MSYPSPTKTGISLTHLVSLSTQVKMSLKDPQRGKAVMKSMDHTEKRSVGLSISYNKLSGAEVDPFAAGKNKTHE